MWPIWSMFWVKKRRSWSHNLTQLFIVILFKGKKKIITKKKGRRVEIQLASQSVQISTENHLKQWEWICGDSLVSIMVHSINIYLEEIYKRTPEMIQKKSKTRNSSRNREGQAVSNCNTNKNIKKAMSVVIVRGWWLVWGCNMRLKTNRNLSHVSFG